MGQWESSPGVGLPSWESLSGTAAASYTPVSGDAGKRLRVVVTYTDGSGPERMVGSASTLRVDQVGKVTISPQTPVVGKAVKATLSDPDGMEANQVWRWARSPYGTESELVWTAIAGAQTSSYTPMAAEDSGKLLRVMVTYDDGTGTGRTASSSATERVDREGVVAMSPSPPVAGQAVTATLTDLDGMVSSEEWKWERSPRTGTPDWEEISGPTTATYTPTAADDGGKILRVTVGYDDAFGTGRTAVSPSTLPVDLLGVVSLSTTMPVAGERVTATLTDGDGGVLNAVWQWESSPALESPEWSDIADATSSKYIPVNGDVGRLLRVMVTYEDSSGLGRVASSVATAQVDVRGTVRVRSRNPERDLPEVGVWQDARLADPDGMVGSQMWKWEIASHAPEDERTWNEIVGAHSGSYKPVSSDAGKVLRVVVTYSDGTGTSREATSAATERVDQPGMIELSSYSDVAVGKEVTATLIDPDGGAVNTVWQWHRAHKHDIPLWTEIDGAVSETYTPTEADAAGILRVTVGYDDNIGHGRVAESPSTGVVDRPGGVTLSTQVPEAGELLGATLEDGDGGVRNVSWQWESCPVAF